MSLEEAILGGIHEPYMKMMWEAALDRAKLYNLHTEAGMGEGEKRGRRQKMFT